MSLGLSAAVAASKAANTIAGRAGGIRRRLSGVRQPESTLAKHNRLFSAAADRLGYAVRDLDGRILEITNGSRRLFVSSTNFSFESLTAYWICGDKYLSATLLAGASLPVPDHAVMSASDYQAGVDAYRELGAPLVVKPVLGACGRGVTVNVSSPGDFRKAFITAAACCSRVLVERYVEGNHWRVTVLDGELIVAWQRIPAFVVGDGVHDISGLIESYNATLAGSGEFAPGLPIVAGRRARRDLAAQGKSLRDVPREGEHVVVYLACNSALGGRTRDVTEEIHPGFVEVAGRAARAVGARFAGVDIIADNITIAPAQGEHYINEVNTTPDMLSPDYALERRKSAVDYAEIVLRKALK